MRNIENKIIRYKKEMYKIIKTYPGGFYMVQNIREDSYVELVLYKDIAPCLVLSVDAVEIFDSQ